MKANPRLTGRILALLLAAALLCGLLPTALAIPAVQPSPGRIVAAQTDYRLMDGVTETTFFLNNSQGSDQLACHMVTVEPGAQATFKASYAGYYTSSDPEERAGIAQNLAWKLQRPSDQAAAYASATGGTVIMATNGDYFNMQTGQPLGALILEGNLVQTGAAGYAPEPYFAVLQDGSFVIRPAGSPVDDVVEAISGPVYLVRDGVNQITETDGELYPVNSIGMKADGSVVTLLVDGRQKPYSSGMTLHDLADLLIAQGVVTALYLDGGGSAVVSTRREGTDALTIQNRPSDGIERAVSSALLLVSTAAPSGVFDHASLTPNNAFYTPTRDGENPTSVAFSAIGVDGAGGPAEIPAEAAWSLADPACGTVDPETGLFTGAVNYTGPVEIRLRLGETVLGTTTIHLEEPDELYFDSVSKSMDFGQTADLGLNARRAMTFLQYKPGDFTWTVRNEAGAEDPAIGSFAGNLFTSGTASGTIHGRAEASYTCIDGRVLTAGIDLEIGKLPLVAFDFEPIDGKPQEAAHFHWGKSDYVNNGMNTNGGYLLRNAESVTVPIHTNNSNHPEEWTYNTFTSPVVFTGNYDTAVPAAEVFRADGYRYYLWPNASIDAYLAGKLGTTSEADGGQVRFGEYALELNFDYASYNGTKNSNYYMRYCGERYLIEGQPTQVGVWVYADAETYNLNGYKLYTDLCVWNGASYGNKNIPLVHDMVKEDGTVYQSTNTDWVGWMYCYANLDGSSYTDSSGNVSNWADLRSNYSPEHPYILRCGEGFLWLSYQPAAGGGRYNGTLYFDNFRYVYGTNLDDLDNPVLDGVAVNGIALSEGEIPVIDAAGVELTASYHDYDGKNASGIAAYKTSFVIDGVPADPDCSETDAVYRLSLANGRHCLTVTVYDEFGNYTTGTYYFDVDNGGGQNCVRVTGAETVTMGTDYVLSLSSVGRVKDCAVQIIQLNSDFGAPTVAFREGWEGTASFVSTGFKKAKLLLGAAWTGPGEAPADAVIGEISFRVPANLDPEVDFFTYQVLSAASTAWDGTLSNVAQEKVTLPLSAYYTVTPGLCIKGRDTVLTVTDPENRPAPGVTVEINGTAAGLTDENGCFVTEISRTADSFRVRAVGGDRVSFTTTVTVYAAAGDPSGKPVNLNETASKNGSTVQTLTWMSNLDASEEAAVVEYARTEDLAEAVTVTGESTVFAFATTKNAARINTVQIQGLTPGTTYYYRAGDGTTDGWSEVRSFRTVPVSGDTRFFILADTQLEGNPERDAESIEMLRQIGARVSGYDFGIQTGDYVDSGANYAMWEEIQTVFSEAFAGVDVIHTLGNHEYSNDEQGRSGTLIFRFDQVHQLCYSVRYGDVYIAVINNMRYGTITAEELRQALAWIAEDARDFKAAWKILSTHQPAYYTNVTGGNERVHEILPAAVDEIGFDLVFSGHDHAYARTEMLRAGQPVSEGGAVYFIGGDLGEKSRTVNYAAYDNPDFHFACVDQEHYDALYLDAAAEGETLTITARNYDGTPIDTVTLHSRCYDGHSFELYEEGCAICEVCGKRFRVEDLGYTGWLTVRGTEDSERPQRMYFLNGVFRTGWFQLDEDLFHFGKDGVLHRTETVDERTCTTPGRLVTVCQDCGARRVSGTLRPEGHRWDEDHVCTVCGFAGVDVSGLPCSGVGEYYVLSRAGQKIRPKPVLKDGEKVLTLSSGNTYDDCQITWWNSEDFGPAGLHVEGRWDYYGELECSYTIVPDKVQGAAVTGIGPDSISLRWDPVYGADSYAVCAWDYSAKVLTELAAVTETECTVTGLASGTSYTLCVRARAQAGGMDWESVSYDWIYTRTDVPAPLDYTALDEALARAEALDRELYTAESLAALEAPLAAARTARTEAGTQAELDAAAEALNAALDALVHSHAYDCPGRNFTDLPPEDNWAHAPIDWAVENGLTNGVSQTLFGLNHTCTRGQVVTFLWRAAGCPDPEGSLSELPFTDLKPGAYYEKAVVWAVENGIASGVSATAFAPHRTAVRGQVVTFLWRAAGSPEPEETEVSFTDVSPDAYYYKAMLWAVAKGVTTGTSASAFRPAAACTRAQVVTFLYRAR